MEKLQTLDTLPAQLDNFQSKMQAVFSQFCDSYRADLRASVNQILELFHQRYNHEVPKDGAVRRSSIGATTNGIIPDFPSTDMGSKLGEFGVNNKIEKSNDTITKCLDIGLMSESPPMANSSGLLPSSCSFTIDVGDSSEDPTVKVFSFDDQRLGTTWSTMEFFPVILKPYPRPRVKMKNNYTILKTKSFKRSARPKCCCKWNHYKVEGSTVENRRQRNDIKSKNQQLLASFPLIGSVSTIQSAITPTIFNLLDSTSGRHHLAHIGVTNIFSGEFNLTLLNGFIMEHGINVFNEATSKKFLVICAEGVPTPSDYGNQKILCRAIGLPVFSQVLSLFLNLGASLILQQLAICSVNDATMILDFYRAPQLFGGISNLDVHVRLWTLLKKCLGSIMITLDMRIADQFVYQKFSFDLILEIGYVWACKLLLTLQLFDKMHVWGLQLDSWDYHILSSALVKQGCFKAVNVISYLILVRSFQKNVMGLVLVQNFHEQTLIANVDFYLHWVLMNDQSHETQVQKLVDFLASSMVYEDMTIVAATSAFWYYKITHDSSSVLPNNIVESNRDSLLLSLKLSMDPNVAMLPKLKYGILMLHCPLMSWGKSDVETQFLEDCKEADSFYIGVDLAHFKTGLHYDSFSSILGDKDVLHRGENVMNQMKDVNDIVSFIGDGSLVVDSCKEVIFGAAQLCGSIIALILIFLSCLLAIELSIGKMISLLFPNQLLGPTNTKCATKNAGKRDVSMTTKEIGLAHSRVYAMDALLRRSMYCIMTTSHGEHAKNLVLVEVKFVILHHEGVVTEFLDRDLDVLEIPDLENGKLKEAEHAVLNHFAVCVMAVCILVAAVLGVYFKIFHCLSLSISMLYFTNP